MIRTNQYEERQINALKFNQSQFISSAPTKSFGGRGTLLNPNKPFLWFS